MTADETKITVAHLGVALDRIEQWLQAVRKGIEAIPQDQEINLNLGELESDLDLKQPWLKAGC